MAWGHSSELQVMDSDVAVSKFSLYTTAHAWMGREEWNMDQHSENEL